MQKPEFKHPDKFQVLPFRDWLRENKPPGPQGYVVEDLDLLIRLYGAAYNTDGKGCFALFELKFKNAWIGRAQKMTFSLVDKLLRLADPERKRYKGYFVIQYDNENWDEANFKVNRIALTQEEFFGILDLDQKIIEKVNGSLFDQKISKGDDIKCPNCDGSIEMGNYHITTGLGYTPEIFYAICISDDECCNFFVIDKSEKLLIERIQSGLE